MKKANKIISALLAVSMLGALGGCGKKEEQANGEVDTLTIWSGNSHSREVMTKWYEQWNETKGKEIGLYIDYQVQGGDSITKNMELALQSGTAPDFISGSLEKLVEAGYALAYDDLPGGPEIIEEVKAQGFDFREGVHTYKGKTYSFPGGPTSQGLIYNKDMFKAAGLVDENGEAKPPKTWAEVVEYAKILTDKSKNQYGIIAPLKWTGWWGSDVSSPTQTLIGFQNFNPAEGKYDFSGYKLPLESWLQMFNDGSVYPGAESLDNDSARAMFAEGNIGMKFGFSFDVGVLNDQFPAKCDWGATTYPLNNDGTGYKHRIDYGGTSIINAKTKVPLEKIAQVIKPDREAAKYSYENCVGLPLDTSVIDEAELVTPKKGWMEFAKIVETSSLVVRAPSTEMGGMENLETMFKKYVMTGEMTVDEAIKKAEENMNKGMKDYYEIHTDKDLNEFIIPDWKPEKLQ